MDILPGWKLILDIIRQNVKELLRISQTEVMAIVKANGYGHGAAEIAKASVQAGATWCGVARLEEAIALRRAGLDCQILVLGYTSPDRVAEAVNNNVCLTIYDQQIGEAYAEQAKECGRWITPAYQGGYRHGPIGYFA